MKLRCAMMLTMLLMAGCAAKSIQLEGHFPTPLIDKFRMPIGVYYSPNFTTFTHEEDIPQSGKVSVKAGAINSALFDKLLPGLFANVERLSSPTATSQVRGVIIPEITEMQFSLPQQTHNGLYEVWLRYSIKLQDREGKVVAQWPLTGYGKSPDGWFVQRTGGLNGAADVALRDVAASFTLSLRDVAEVQHWLETETAALNKSSTP